MLLMWAQMFVHVIFDLRMLHMFQLFFSISHKASNLVFQKQIRERAGGCLAKVDITIA